MIKIITISREFGSGGRELGKRLADLLGWDYYDKEIITAIAENKNLDEGYVSRMLENHGWKNVPLSFRSSFAATAPSMQTALLVEQKQVIENIAKQGKDFVIVGRNADVILQEYQPFSVFVCADMKERVRRCIEYAPENEKLTGKEIEKKIRSIDKNRFHAREILTESKWGDKTAYQLVINTTDWDLKELTMAVKTFADCWFHRKG